MIGLGDEFIWCIDFPKTYLIDKYTKIGYYKSSVELVVHLEQTSSYYFVYDVIF